MAERPLRIVIVSWHFPPSQEIGGKVVWRLAKHLALLGCDVRVLVAPLSEIRYRDDEYARVLPPGLRVIRTSVDTDVAGNAYRFVKSLLKFRKPAAPPAAPTSDAAQPPVTGDGFRDYIRRLLAFGRYDRWIKPASRSLLATLADEPADLVMSVSPPFQAHSAVMRVRHALKSTPWYVWLHDPGNHHLVATGQLSKVLVGRHLIGRMLARKRARTERRVIESADRMVVTSQRLADDYLRLLPALRTPILVPCGFDIEEASCAPAAPGAKLALVYVGTIYSSQTPRPIIESLARLRAARLYRPDELEVKFVGRLENEEGKALKTVVEQLGMGDVITSSPQVPHAEALQLVANASVGLAMAELLPTQIPAKMYEYIALRKPVLALADGVTLDLVVDNAIGYACGRDGLDAALSALVTQWRADRLASFDPALEAAARRYDMANIARDFLVEARADVEAAARA